MIDTVAVILAAGKSSRMGVPSKALVHLGGQTLLSRIVARLDDQVTQVVINGDKTIFDAQNLPVIEDKTAAFSGPLAGLHSAMSDPSLQWVESFVIVPCDSPFLPLDLVSVLVAALGQSDVACVRYKGILQPTFSLWRKQVAKNVSDAVFKKGNGGFKPLLSSLNTAVVDWPEQAVNPFFNINTSDDLRMAEENLCH
jgi:molybdopterin-guanine dinucleotide biosynthesis protein A